MKRLALWTGRPALKEAALLGILLPVVFLPGSLICAQTLPVRAGKLRQKLSWLRPGRRLLLLPGHFAGGVFLRGLHGTKGKPIIMEGTPGRSILVARQGANTIQLDDCSYVVLRNLILDGRGLPVDAIKAGGASRPGVHHITIENCLIRGHGNDQSIVGISTKVAAWDWIIRNNTILGAGTGLYLGNSDGRDPFIGGLIEGNIIQDCHGYSMQIKHQYGRPRLSGIPQNPRSTIIRYNTFIKDDQPSEAGNRPSLLVGGFPRQGLGSKDRYQIYGNIFFGNPRENLFQGTGSLSLHDNLFAASPHTAIRVMRHHGQSPKSLKVYHNSFLWVFRALRITDMPQEKSHRLIMGNLVRAGSLGDLPPATNLLTPDHTRARPPRTIPDIPLIISRRTLPRVKLLEAALGDDLDSKRDLLWRLRPSMASFGALITADSRQKLSQKTLRQALKRHTTWLAKRRR